MDITDAMQDAALIALEALQHEVDERLEAKRMVADCGESMVISRWISGLMMFDGG